MKRRLSSSEIEEIEEIEEFKKRKKIEENHGYNYIIDNSWNSASSVHNYLLNDPILDYFKFNSSNFSGSNDSNFEGSFLKYILNKGTIFENNVISLIKQKLSENDFVKVAQDFTDIRNPLKFKETIDLMSEGIPVIYQGVLHDYENKVYGSPDLIIRSDFINKIMDEKCIVDVPDKEYEGFIYKIIDIKFNTLKLRADGIHLLNTGRTKCNKGQIIIYNNMLSKILKYNNRYCYILGRGYTYYKNGSSFKNNSCFSKLGHIDTIKIDEPYHEKIDNALSWITDVKKNHNSYILRPPSRKELYPNMCNTYDMPYHNLKKQLASEIKEITLLWNVGVEHRENAHEKGIFKYDDPLLSTDILKTGSGKKTNVIGEMLSLLHSNKLMNKNKIENDYEFNIFKKCPLEFYIDFETINNIVDDFTELPKISIEVLVFMIGLYSVQIDEFGNEICQNFTFTAKNLDRNSEKQIFKEMYETIATLIKESNININSDDDINFYHWSHAEPSIFKNILDRYSEISLKNCDFYLNFCDICKIFQSEPILFKGIFDFSLKSISKFMMQNSMIDSEYNYSDITCGLEAMILAYNAYKQLPNNSLITDNEIIKKIINYNKIDCILIYKIVTFLRTLQN